MHMYAHVCTSRLLSLQNTLTEREWDQFITWYYQFVQ